MVIFGNEAFQTVAYAENGTHAVTVVGFQHHGADDVVQAGAQSAAGDDGGLGLAGIVVDMFAGTGLFDINGGVFQSLDVFAAVLGVEIEGDGSVVDIGPYGRVIYFGLAHRHDMRIYFVSHLSLQNHRAEKILFLISLVTQKIWGTG